MVLKKVHKKCPAGNKTGWGKAYPGKVDVKGRRDEYYLIRLCSNCAFRFYYGPTHVPDLYQ
ncbi:MAG: hypothetical protein P9M10_01060 [Candidatus Euphemobacter frigidus]|nr:hypothetical protein [Candidatus Euphemobacter frigidus]